MSNLANLTKKKSVKHIKKVAAQKPAQKKSDVNETGSLRPISVACLPKGR